ncbi:hypothetical protein [Halioglobus sp. HI00S01]|uniref:hypothetical protein n=1 Tax=Halioglobus sp. HI00S01 TaxID=1822214 RepID=UPI0012E8B551|nr:hypothetical protein [Halioglobus sp. HI00S01]
MIANHPDYPTMIDIMIGLTRDKLAPATQYERRGDGRPFELTAIEDIETGQVAAYLQADL